jgi:hypothetical protein
MSTYTDTPNSPEPSESHTARKIFEVGGVVAAVVLVAFGIAAIVLGSNGLSTVHTSIEQQKIKGDSKMTPTEVKAAFAAAGLSTKGADLPTCSVSGVTLTNGSQARCFAGYMRTDALEATGGLTFSEMGMYLTPAGKPTSVKADAAVKEGKPVTNPAREIWVEETALATALNASYMAEQISIFGIVVGVALLLTGLGFAVLTIGGALQNQRSDRLLRLVSRRRGTEKAADSASTPTPVS